MLQKCRRTSRSFGWPLMHAQVMWMPHWADRWLLAQHAGRQKRSIVLGMATLHLAMSRCKSPYWGRASRYETLLLNHASSAGFVNEGGISIKWGKHLAFALPITWQLCINLRQTYCTGPSCHLLCACANTLRSSRSKPAFPCAQIQYAETGRAGGVKDGFSRSDAMKSWNCLKYP